jgi:hypothetical protein
VTGVRRGLDLASNLLGATATALMLGAMAVVFIWRPLDGWARFALLLAIVGAGLGAERLLAPSQRKLDAEPTAVRAVRRGLDVFVDLLGSAAWALAVFVLGARLISTPAGGLLALATFITIAAFSLQTYLQEARTRALATGACPRCKASIASEHRHRRWDAERSAWLAPVTSWECDACGYGHSESFMCPACPTAE